MHPNALVYANGEAQLKLQGEFLRIDNQFPEPATPKLYPLQEVQIIIIEQPQVLMSSELADYLLNSHILLFSLEKSFYFHRMMVPVAKTGNFYANWQLQNSIKLPQRRKAYLHLVKLQLLKQAAVLESFGMCGKYLRQVHQSITPTDYAADIQSAEAYYQSQLRRHEVFQHIHPQLPYTTLFKLAYDIFLAQAVHALYREGMNPTQCLFKQLNDTHFELAGELLLPMLPLLDVKLLHHLATRKNVEALTSTDKTAICALLLEPLTPADTNSCRDRIQSNATILWHFCLGHDFEMGKIAC